MNNRFEVSFVTLSILLLASVAMAASPPSQLTTVSQRRAGLQPKDRLEFDGPFSVFLLARPVKQARDFMYFGVFHWSTLLHALADNSQRFKNGEFVTLTDPDAVAIDHWQLIEVHRDKDEQLRCVVNGAEKTLGIPEIGRPFRLVHFMNNNKGVWKRFDPFTGDLVALMLYSDVFLSEKDRQQIRNYFDGVYEFK